MSVVLTVCVTLVAVGLLMAVDGQLRDRRKKAHAHRMKRLDHFHELELGEVGGVDVARTDGGDEVDETEAEPTVENNGIVVCECDACSDDEDDDELEIMVGVDTTPTWPDDGPYRRAYSRGDRP